MEQEFPKTDAEYELQQWAHNNYRTGDLIKDSWHPIIRKECEQMIKAHIVEQVVKLCKKHDKHYRINSRMVVIGSKDKPANLCRRFIVDLAEATDMYQGWWYVTPIDVNYMAIIAMASKQLK